MNTPKYFISGGARMIAHWKTWSPLPLLMFLSKNHFRLKSMLDVNIVQHKSFHFQ